MFPFPSVPVYFKYDITLLFEDRQTCLVKHKMNKILLESHYNLFFKYPVVWALQTECTEDDML